MPGGRAIAVNTGTYELRNEAGSWLCHTASVSGASDMGSNAETNLCLGSGGYTGLSAILLLDWAACQPQFTTCATSPVKITGAIFPGGLPPTP